MDTQNPSAPPRAQSRIAGEKPPPPARAAAERPPGRRHPRQHPPHRPLHGDRQSPRPAPGAVRAGHRARRPHPVPPHRRPRRHQNPRRPLPRGPDPHRRRPARTRSPRLLPPAPGGRIVTRTVSCNQPGHHGTEADTPRTPTRRAAAAPDKRPSRKLLPAVPQPACSSPTLLQTATDLLAGLRRHDPRLLLSATDAAHLAPGVAAWLERDLTPTVVQRALTTDLPPEVLRRPAALLAHRLAAQLPPPPPFRAPASPLDVRHPLRTCDSCDRAFRSPAPGRCRDCRTPLAEAA